MIGIDVLPAYFTNDNKKLFSLPSISNNILEKINFDWELIGKD